MIVDFPQSTREAWQRLRVIRKLNDLPHSANSWALGLPALYAVEFVATHLHGLSKGVRVKRRRHGSVLLGWLVQKIEIEFFDNGSIDAYIDGEVLDLTDAKNLTHVLVMLKSRAR